MLYYYVFILCLIPSVINGSDSEGACPSLDDAPRVKSFDIPLLSRAKAKSKKRDSMKRDSLHCDELSLDTLHSITKTKKTSPETQALMQENGVKKIYETRNRKTGDNFLHEVVKTGKLKNVQKILKVNAEGIDEQNKAKKTPLMVALDEGFYDIAQELLLERGAAINIKDKKGNTGLMYLTLLGQDDLMSKTLKQRRKSIDDISTWKLLTAIDEPNDRGRTPLMIALMKGFHQIASMLIYYNASVEMKDKRGDVPLMYKITGPIANNNMDATAASALMNNVLNVQNKKGITPLMLAIQCAKPEEVDRLLYASNDLDFCIRDDQGDWALMSAISLGHTEIALRLIEKIHNAQKLGVDLMSKDTKQTPMMVAVKSGYLDIVKALIELGADVLAIDNAGYDARYYALESSLKSEISGNKERQECYSKICALIKTRELQQMRQQYQKGENI